MAVLKRLEELFKEKGAAYRTVVHPEAYTAQEAAAGMHVPGRTLAKVVMVRSENKFFMAVLPAPLRADLDRLKEALGVKDLRLAREDEFKDLFPDCTPGAEPPFGNLYGIETVVDSCLAGEEQIYFNAGTHDRAVEMSYRDYERLVKPKEADFCVGPLPRP